MRVFLSKKEKYRYRRNLRLKIYSLAGLSLLLVILSVYALFNLPFFKIKSIEASDGVNIEDTKAEVLKNKFSGILGLDNFLSWPGKIGKDIEVEKDLFSGTLKLIGNFPDKFAIWCSEECYWASRRGLILSLAPDTEGTSIPKIKDLGIAYLTVNKPILAEDLFTNIANIIEGLEILPLRIRGFEFNDRLQELIAYGTKEEKIIFSVRFTPPEKSFNYLKDLTLSGALRNSEYVDLTVENRIYLR